MRPYARKISGEEAKAGYLLLNKDRLRDFPSVGEVFTLTREGDEAQASVESYRCTCRGPRRPHEHWYIRPPGAPLHRGDEATITQQTEDPPVYAISVKRPWTP
jgi:hypothetical protein